MKFSLEEELIMWIMKTSITQIWMVCHLFPFAKVGQNTGQHMALNIPSNLWGTENRRNLPCVVRSSRGERKGVTHRSMYYLNKKEWICSLFKEWILEKSEIRVNLEWTFVLFTHFGVTTGITQGFRVIPEVTPKWVNNTNVHSKFTPNSL